MMDYNAIPDEVTLLRQSLSEAENRLRIAREGSKEWEKSYYDMREETYTERRRADHWKAVTFAVSIPLALLLIPLFSMWGPEEVRAVVSTIAIFLVSLGVLGGVGAAIYYMIRNA